MEQKSFTGFMKQVIQELEEEERFSTAYIYRYALRAFILSIGGGEVFWGGFTKRALWRFQLYLEKLERSYNTISTYIRVLRAVYNRGVDAGQIQGEYRMFAKLKTGVSSEKKLSVTADQMQKLVQTLPDQPEPSSITQAQDTLALMVLLQGMPFADLARLKKSNLKGNLLTCHRRKTGTELCVEVLPEAMELIDRYRNNNAASPYLLNFLTSGLTEEEAFIEYRNKLRELNLQLSKLPALCGIKDIKVSTYTARHTWATLAKYCHVPEELISEGLGHSSLEVTRTYLKSFESNKLAKANKLVYKCIFEGKKEVWNGA